jgi:uncharacterized protein YgiM (DUF1202 family)
MRHVRLLAAICLACVAATAFAADAKQMSVTVKETQVRDKPTYLGKVLGVLAYGDRVTVLDQPAGAPQGWLKVSGPGGKLTGWVNASALTEKQIVMKSGSDAVSQSASAGDVALAGKGFNADVEAQYKQDKKLDYSAVDAMEAVAVDPKTISLFLSQGGLTEPGGAQ